MQKALRYGMRVVGFVLILLAGRIYFAWHVALQIHIPANDEGMPMNVVVRVVKLQSIARDKVRFIVRIDSKLNVSNHLSSALFHSSIMLSAYGYHPLLQVGQVYELKLKLRDLRSLYSPKALGYKHWLMANHIAFIGYVVGREWKLIAPAKQMVLQQWRDAATKTLDSVTASTPMQLLVNEFMIALTTGERSYISKLLWAILRGTGTSHLVAISGLHLGLLAVIGYYFFAWGIRCIPRILLYLPAQRFGQFGALVFATFFAAFSGWSIPTERAWLMLLVFTVTQWCYQAIKPWQSLLCAAVVLLLWHPLAVLSVSFWLSVIAVASVLVAVATTPKHKHWLWKWCYFQTCITVFLLPITWFYFSFVASNAFWANLITVPVVTMVILPGTLLSLWWHWLLLPLGWLTVHLLALLKLLTQWMPPITWQMGYAELMLAYGLLVLAIYYGCWQRYWWLGLLLAGLILPIISVI